MKNNTQTTMLHMRVDRALRDDVKKLADRMGVSVSLVAETLFKRFLEEKKLVIKESYIPNKELRSLLDEANENREKSTYWEKHSSVESLMADLKK